MLVEQSTIPRGGQFVMSWEINNLPYAYTLKWVSGSLYKCIPPMGDSDVQWKFIHEEDLPKDSRVRNIRYYIVEED